MLVNRRLFLLLSTTFVAGAIITNKKVGQAASCTVINVKNHGAVGDGFVDDTAAIQRAIDIGCSVYFPAGVYKVNGLNLRSNCTYYGDGEKSVINLFQKKYSRKEVNNYQSNSAFNLKKLQKVTIRNLRFVCPTSIKKNKPNDEYANIAVDIQSSSNCQLESLIVEKFSGIAILCAGSSDTDRCANISINNVKVRNWYDAYEGSFPQIWFYKYVHDSTVQNCSLEGGTFGIGFYDAYNGTKIKGRGKNSPGAGVYRCSAINNVIKNQSRYGILMYCTRSVAFPNELVEHTIKGNTITNILGSSHIDKKAFGAGIYAVGVTGLTISNNTVSNCNQQTTVATLAPGCIGVANCYGNVLIDGNTCSDGKWSNLYISGVLGKLVVTNNILKNSVKENLFCYNCNNAIFSGNNISSGQGSKLAPVSLRSVRNVDFRDNTIFFDSLVNQDAMFLFQSSNLKIIDNKITTLNPVSINRIQEVSDSIISGNIYNSANPSSQESIRFSKGKNNQFINNTINKRTGGKKIMTYQ